MNIHHNARLTPLGRERMVRAIVEGGQTPQAAARAAGVCPRTARKWVDRFKAEGLAGLADRSSRPQRLRQPTSPAVVDQVIALRRQRLPGQHIAKAAGVSPATVSRILKRAGLSRLRDLEPPEPVRRYERQHPGELIHIDIKKLGRFHQVGHRITGDRRGQSNARSRGEGAGWEFVHVCIDDASRIAFTMIMPDEKAKSAIAFLKAAVAYYNSLGVTVAGVMTDNGSCYKAFAFDRACKRLKLKHIRTRPYTPKTNGKAERFVQTALREWAYAKPYNTSNERAQQFQPWTDAYNWAGHWSGYGSSSARTIPTSWALCDLASLSRLWVARAPERAWNCSRASSSGLPGCSVCQASDWTVQGVLHLVIELVQEKLLALLGVLALGDVLDNAHGVLEFARGAVHRGARDARPADAAVGSHMRLLERVDVELALRLALKSSRSLAMKSGRVAWSKWRPISSSREWAAARSSRNRSARASARD